METTCPACGDQVTDGGQCGNPDCPTVQANVEPAAGPELDALATRPGSMGGDNGGG